MIYKVGGWHFKPPPPYALHIRGYKDIRIPLLKQTVTKLGTALILNIWEIFIWNIFNQILKIVSFRQFLTRGGGIKYNPFRRLVITPKWLHLLYGHFLTFPRYSKQKLLEKFRLKFFTPIAPPLWAVYYKNISDFWKLVIELKGTLSPHKFFSYMKHMDPLST